MVAILDMQISHFSHVIKVISQDNSQESFLKIG